MRPNHVGPSPSLVEGEGRRGGGGGGVGGVGWESTPVGKWQHWGGPRWGPRISKAVSSPGEAMGGGGEGKRRFHSPLRLWGLQELMELS